MSDQEISYESIIKTVVAHILSLLELPPASTKKLTDILTKRISDEVILFLVTKEVGEIRGAIDPSLQQAEEIKEKLKDVPEEKLMEAIKTVTFRVFAGFGNEYKDLLSEEEKITLLEKLKKITTL